MDFVVGSGPGVEKNIACFGGLNFMRYERSVATSRLEEEESGERESWFGGERVMNRYWEEYRRIIGGVI